MSRSRISQSLSWNSGKKTFFFCQVELTLLALDRDCEPTWSYQPFCKFLTPLGSKACLLFGLIALHIKKTKQKRQWVIGVHAASRRNILLTLAFILPCWEKQEVEVDDSFLLALRSACCFPACFSQSSFLRSVCLCLLSREHFEHNGYLFFTSYSLYCLLIWFCWGLHFFFC